MKKILIFAACVATLVSCADEQQKLELYCEHEVSRFYTDANAEMDTLSYATGMNLGLMLSIQNGYLNIDAEQIIDILDKELKIVQVEDKQMQKHNDYLNEFNNARVRNYFMAKQANSRIKTDCPDTLTLPEIYDETYTPARFNQALGALMANSLRAQRIPANLYWVYEAIREAQKVKSKDEIDANMRLTEAEFISAMQKYVQEDLAAYDKELNTKWLERVSKQEGVKLLEEVENIADGVYYRIDRQGNDVKADKGIDSIAVKYSVYSRTGRLLESDQTFVEQLERQKQQIANDKRFPDSLRTKYIKQIDAEIEKSAIRKLPLNRFMQPDIQSAIKLIGEGGQITIWTDGIRGLGYRAQRLLPPNEGIVINIELIKVKDIPVPESMPATINTVRPSMQKQPTKVAPKVVPPKKK